MLLVRSNHFIATDIGRHHRGQIPSCGQQKDLNPDQWSESKVTSEPKEEVL